ncbi:hypothetical protein M0811_07101 [Anaeramoeba ignava]|uniref:Uncharacterized protein n=1 Tax=Anaeramoeba ignava TaxID=1746090 RepID=A0A9Q0LL80_ANAIG|nr:hypothetical protein M0811_07101 [Anaeramoeba ignava]|eukprot:Anaeramoba_ignava/a482457_374.p1 GENE.a482457_374~~a482457_374.p1  ORF type:complete len:345 (+),score=117.71 a482457_374:30-1064(+)
MGNSPNAIQIPKNKVNGYLKRIKTTKEAVAVLSPLKDILHFNEPFLILFKGSKRQAKKMKIMSQIPRTQSHLEVDNSAAFVEKQISLAIADSSGRVSFDLRMKTLSGELFWAHVSLLLVNLGGKPAGQTMFQRTEGPLKEDINEISNQQWIPETNDSSENMTSETTQVTTNVDSDVVVISHYFSDSQPQSFSTGSLPKELHSPKPRFARSKTEPLFVINEEVNQKIDSTKSLVRSNENMELEHLVVPKLNLIEEIFVSVMSRLDSEINETQQTINFNRLQFKKKYSNLEENLQRRLEGMKIEQEAKIKISSENQEIKNVCKNIQQMVQEMQKISDKISEKISVK